MPVIGTVGGGSDHRARVKGVRSAVFSRWEILRLTRAVTVGGVDESDESLGILEIGRDSERDTESTAGGQAEFGDIRIDRESRLSEQAKQRRAADVEGGLASAGIAEAARA